MGRRKQGRSPQLENMFSLILALALILGMVSAASVSAAENVAMEEMSLVSTQDNTKTSTSENIDIFETSNDDSSIGEEEEKTNSKRETNSSLDLEELETQNTGSASSEEEGTEDETGGLRTDSDAQATVQPRAVNWIVTGGTLVGVAYATLASAISAINANPATSFTIIGGGGSESNNTVLSINAGKNITINGGGAIVSQTASGRHFRVYGSLELTDIVLDGGSIEGGIDVLSTGFLIINVGTTVQNCVSTTPGGGVSVSGGGTFTMNAGAIVQNISSGQFGGGIYADDSSHFVMRGGTVANNSVTSSGDSYGGGIYIYQSSFLITGGTIEGNTATHGGGVRIDFASMTMDGGTISGNSATSDGGGVYLARGTFDMNAGSISNNRAAQYGGGIESVIFSTFTMRGGSISNNFAGDGNSQGYGGGVHTASASESFVYGGTISENTSTHFGGGVALSSLDDNQDSTFTLDGGSIQDNEAGFYGGGIFNIDDSSFVMKSGAIAKNSAFHGGGIYNEGSLNIQSGSISGNTAAAYGGGIFNYPMEVGAYANLTIAETVVFSNNISVQAVAPPPDPLTTYPTIQSSSSSVYDSPLNNDDISRTMIEVNVYYVDQSGNAIGDPTSLIYWEGQTNTFTLATSSIPPIANYVYAEWKAGINGSLQGNTPIRIEGISPETTNDLYLIYDVYEDSFIVDKFVGDPGSADYDSANLLVSKNRPVAIGEHFGWSVVSSIPSNLHPSVSETYVVSDSMSEYFDYIEGTITVYSVPSKDTSIASAYQLSSSIDYSFDYNSTAHILTVNLSETGMALLSERYQTEGDRFLLIKYDGALNEKAPGGVALFSSATAEHTFNTSQNVSSQTTASVINQPEVSTGKIEVIKRGSDTGKILPHASFGLAETEADARVGNFIATGATGMSGSIVFNGLHIGVAGDGPGEDSANTSFWLVETRAPEGYQVMEGVLKITAGFEQGDAHDYYFARVKLSDDPERTPKTPDKSSGENIAKTGDTNAVALVIIVVVVSSLILVGARRIRRS